MQEQLNQGNQLSVFFAIVRSNILLNARRYLFLKQLILIILFVSILFLLNRQYKLLYPTTPFLPAFLSQYIIITLMFISRSGIIEYADHKNKYFYPQKAYGISGYTYLAAWGTYSMISGMLKTLVVVGLTYALFSGEISQGGSLPINVEQLCLMIFVAYFAFYSYSLFFNAILPYNFIGIRLITPIFLCSLLQQTSATDVEVPASTEFSIELNPARWIIAILWWSPAEKYTYTFFRNTALAQFFIPILSSIIIQVIKFQRFQIKNWFLGFVKNRRQKTTEDYLLPQSNSDKRLLLVSLKGLNKSFGRQQVLKNISLDIISSETIVLFGKNSSGKSALLNIIASVSTITSGKMLKKEGIRIGMCFQESHSYEEFTVKENLSFHGRSKNIGQLQSRIDYLLESFELNQIADKKVYKLSGGNKKKLSLALAFLGKNDLILIDEPTLGVDVVIKKEIWRILRRQKTQNHETSFVVSSSDPELELIQMATRFWTLSNGQLIVDCTLSELQQSPSFMVVEVKNIRSADETSMRPFYSLQSQDKIKMLHKVINGVEFQLLPIHWQKFKRVLAENNLFENISMFRTAHLKDKLRKIANSQTNVFQQSLAKYFTIIQQITPSTPWFHILKACILVRLTQMIPNITQAIALIFLLPTIWLFFIVSLNTDRSNWVAVATFSFPTYYFFLYPQIYYTHVRSRERKEEEMMFVHGLKKVSYWFVSTTLDILLLIGQYIILLILLYISKGFSILDYHTSAELMTVLNTICFLAVSIILVKIYSLFFDLSIFAFTFLPFILAIVTQLAKFIFGLLSSQETIMVLRLIVPFMEYLLFEVYHPSYLQLYAYFFVQITIYFLLLITIPTLRFKYRNKQKDLSSDTIPAINSIDKINEKLRVSDWEQSLTAKDEITIENLYLQYSKATIIKQMYLGVEKGTIFGLLGRNGSGKTTTLRLASSLISRTTGYVYFGNKVIRSASSSIYQVMGYCPQFDYFHPEMSVERHLTIVLILKRVPLQFHKELCEVMLQIFGMQSVLKMKIKLLSEGEKCKLKIITALLCNPKGKYVLLDEPTVGLDEASQQTFSILLLSAAKALKITFLYITHSISEAEHLCDRVGILQRGEFININSPRQLVIEFSRGYTIKIKAKDLNKLREQMQPKVQSLFQINEWRQDQKQRTVDVSIPRLYFGMGKAVAILEQLQLDPNCIFYCLKEDNFEEVFDYLATRNHQQNDQRQRQTQMIDITR